ncbi:MAG TPA: AAA domain-containing protein [Ktedonobacteraceae bacterium]|nr:AAA domain-containing protein [Ktedonobacteraceae bacterium]
MNRFEIYAGPIHMVMNGKSLQKLREKQQRYPYLPEPHIMLAQLQDLNHQGGVPAAVIKSRDGKEHLELYTSSYYLALYDSPQHDGYTIAHLESLNLNTHERLRQGTLWLRTQGWYLYSELSQIPRANGLTSLANVDQNSWGAITRAWRQLEQHKRSSVQEQPEQLSRAHEHYLDLLEDLIDVTQRLDQEKNSLNTGIPYRQVESAGEERGTLRDIYIFRLTDVPQLNEKSMLRVKGAPADLRGRVMELEGTKLTLKFEKLINRKHIPDHGELEPVMSPIIYDKQREAVQLLREGNAKNVHLLQVLVDHRYQAYQPDPILQSSDRELMLLTPDEQFESFRRALTVPDFLMVLGPPGTGKTRTITEITRYCGLRHKRVLLASGTHKAVDNVLERMPPELSVVRFGHESNISEKMRSKMIDVRAQELQKMLLDNTAGQMEQLSAILTSTQEDEARETRLTQEIANLARQEEYLQVLYQQRARIEERVTAPFKPGLTKIEAALQQRLNDISRAQNGIVRLDERQSRARIRSLHPLVGWIFKILLSYYLSRIARRQQLIQEAQPEVERLRQEQASLQQARQQALLADDEYQNNERTFQYQVAIYDNMWMAQLNIASALQTRIASAVATQPPLQPKGVGTLQRYLSWYRREREQLERKARLMQDWREEVGRATDQLYPELLHYADVVGVTCIGAATARGLENIEFDLAIVDEAGQIGLPDLLVPLVRARRAVLVGDHNQLPPFVDSEVQTWLRNLSAQTTFLTEDADVEVDVEQVKDLLTRSAFEQLFLAREDPAHLVRFTRQGRMPRVIADFASRHFYNGRLGTFEDEKMRHTLDHDPLFRYPFVVVDTADAPPNIRYEQEQKTLENLNESGYVNVIEARLIASIAEVYQRAGKEWVVIVPYRAQARRIIRELEKLLDAHDFALEERVSTVDSFQGGERNKVIYGFTRSNERGKIGFLKELRRLNVAMTRAQQQLVLVGNFSTLTKSEDDRFNYVMMDLQRYASQNGELLTSSACLSRLRNSQTHKSSSGA